MVDLDISSDPCPWCNETYVLDLFEVWPGERAWMFETCCEEAHQEILFELQVDPNNATALLKPLFRSYGIPLRSIYLDLDEIALRLDYGLQLCRVTFAQACSFIQTHHQHHPPPWGWRWGHAVRNGPDLVGVATVGRPVARAYDPALVAEVTRLCTSRDLHPSVTRHAASMLYAAAARAARARRFQRILTYTLETESGVSLIAAGWHPAARIRGKSWNTPARPRIDRAPTTPKIRWEKGLRPRRLRDPVQRELLFRVAS